MTSSPAPVLVTFEIETQDMGRFTTEFAKLTKKAAKLGVVAPSYLVVQADKVYPAQRDVAGTLIKRARVVNVVSVSGQAPRLNGWTFLACLQHEEAGNIIRTVPGVTIQANLDLRTVPPLCQHCNLDRRRNDTYVVAHDDGRQLQVGRNCLKDFTGHDSPEAIARWAELLHAFVASVSSSDGDEGGGGAHAEYVATLDDYLPFVVASIQKDGWLSRTLARDRGLSATADLAWNSRFPNVYMKKENILVPSEGDVERANKALAVARTYFEERAVETLSDYEHNLRIVVESLSVTSRTSGIAASLVNFSERLVGQEIERRRLAQQALVSEYVGTVGKRETFTLTVAKILDLDGQYGVSHLHMFVDAAGNAIKWFSSTQRLDVGTTYTVKGTVKSHDEYKGVKQTMLTRCQAEKASQKA